MPTTNTITIGLTQHACTADTQANINRACELIREAAGKGATLVITQELFAGLYFPQEEDDQHFDLAEPIPGPTSNQLCELAKKLGIHISGSLFERAAAGLYFNTSIMIDPAGNIIDRYRKMHIPDDPRFYEKYYFTPGDLGFRAQQLSQPDLTTGMLVCWDQWYPEAARLTALHGAQLLLYPTAIGWHAPETGGGETAEERPKQVESWRTIPRSHAIANGVFVAAANRVGREGELLFWGRSFIADPSGTIIAEADGETEQSLTAQIDLSLIEQRRRGWPFLRDRRIDAYAPITSRYLGPNHADPSK